MIDTPSTAQFDQSLMALGQARQTDPDATNARVLSAAGLVLVEADGAAALYDRVKRFESAGVFKGTDWDDPAILRPDIAKASLRTGEPQITVIEALSQLRLLAVARGDYDHPRIAREHARQFITQVMALNLDLLSGRLSEADRNRPFSLGPIVAALYRFEIETMGYESILESLVTEVWRILDQRPIKVDAARAMVIQIAKCLFDPELDTDNDAARRLVNALFAPTRHCTEDPGASVYAERLATLGSAQLAEEARAFAAAMHDTGLVSDYHAVFVRHLLTLGPAGQALIPFALGLSSTGSDALRCYEALVHTLIERAIFVETAQAIYGLTCLLERGMLYSVPVATGLWRQLSLKLCPAAEATLGVAFGDAHGAEAYLLAGTLSLLGQPRGVGQGNNPTCQSVIGLAMWADNDPDYLLELIAWVARDDDIVMRFEGDLVSSRHLAAGLAKQRPLDVDPVSMLVVPHLDRLYIEMGRLCAERVGDAHRWIHPALYGWWVGQGFRVVTDPATDRLQGHEAFVRDFYAAYHPTYNGNIPVVHPQPAGIAATDSAARYIGRHAIVIRRVALDSTGEMRVFFFNPNNDSGQDWGQAIETATRGHGEQAGEASLPFHQFASRLFVFHFDPLQPGEPAGVPADTIQSVLTLAEESWTSAFR
jgi:hypothetical protein